ncbi:hypothetical protein ARMSODRAFT_983918 [Armillaria solidipes]|uniref:Uncharacterized protein n=1 Tax=Armillaria solidipes TaxID=1076256 RepID=A0A2H3B3B8_9AGAR|nr:hypothetical protein ARMSODRAFT_983918 [Armillaria solidipes]
MTQEIDLTVTSSQIQRIETVNIQVGFPLSETCGRTKRRYLLVKHEIERASALIRTLRRITGVLPHLSNQSHVNRSTLFPPSKTTSPAPLLLAYSRAIALQPSSAQRFKFLHHSRKLSGTIAPEEEGAHHFSTCPKFRKLPDADSFNYHHPTKSSRRGAYEPQHVRGQAVPYCTGNNATLTPYCYFSLRLLVGYLYARNQNS